MRILHFAIVALTMMAPAYTQTTPPAAPSLTAGAEFKGLRFDWDAAAGASSYRLEYRAHQTGPFVLVGSTLPASATSKAFRLPLHLFDWTFARYRLAACNSAGCTRSPEVSVSLLRRFAVGYFKAENTIFGMEFGDDTDLSPDGLNFVSAAPGDTIFSGNTTANGGAIYVFRRGPDGAWFQRARLQPTIPPFIESTNIMNVAISADGNTVALGMPNYWHEEHDPRSGEVFVFRFNGTSWTRTRLSAIARGAFGRWVALNDAGDTLAIARGEALDPPVPRRVDIYKLANGAWTPVRSIGDMPGLVEFCDHGVFSRDGSTVAEACSEISSAGTQSRLYVRTHSGPNWTVREDVPLELPVTGDFGFGSLGLGIDASGDTIAAQVTLNHGPEPNTGPAEVLVFKRSAGVYSKVAALTPGAWRPDAQINFYGLEIAVSGDGGTIAVGDPWDNGLGTGPRAAPLNPGTARTGAVYIYRFSNSWRLVNMVKPNYQPVEQQSFGRELALSGSGQTLIVGEGGEDGAAEGIGGDWSNLGTNGSGAVWMY
jgi:hypothetical protein